MPETLFHSQSGITLLGGGPVTPAQIMQAAQFAPDVVAADCGADWADASKNMLKAIIGDMDSLKGIERFSQAGVAVHRLTEQDSTDFEKCIYSTAAPITIGLGFVGGRVDHELAVLSTLVKYADRPVIVLSDQDCICACPPDIQLVLPIGTRVSLMPLQPVRGRRSTGLHWPIDDLAFAPGAMIGTSNRSTARDIRIQLDGPGCLLILPADQLPAMVSALSTPAG